MKVCFLLTGKLLSELGVPFCLDLKWDGLTFFDIDLENVVTNSLLLKINE